jgi:hypothetical protein
VPAGPTWPNNLVASAAPHWLEMLLVITSAAAGGREGPVVCGRKGLWRIGREGGRSLSGVVRVGGLVTRVPATRRRGRWAGW